MSALDWLDRAFALVRLVGRRYGTVAWIAGAPLALLGVFAFYLERVEGVRSARVALALGLGLAWWWRTHLFGVACERALTLLEEWDASASTQVDRRVPPRTRAACSLGLAGVAGVILAGALLPAAGLSRAGGFGTFVGLGFALPIGALAPSWLAQAGVADHGGLRAWMSGLRDGAGLRGSALLVHGFLLVGALLLFANVLAVVGMVLGGLQGLVGMEVAALGAFMSFDNDFALVAAAAATLWLMEPLRGAIALVALLHGRSRRDGADLRRMVDGVSAARDNSTRAASRGRSAAAVVLTAALLHGGGAHAQEPPTAPDDVAPAYEAPSDAEYAAPVAESDYLGSPVDDFSPPPDYELPPLAARDEATAARLATILAGSEFREFDDARAAGEPAEGETWLERMLEALARWLRENQGDERSGSASSGPMPVPPTWLFILLAVVLLLAVVAYVALTWRREQEPARELRGALGLTHDPRERAPEEHLGEAARLAERGLFREAFRSLYLATLVALDRHREIDFDPARTNWHYLRQMGEGARATSFRTFTRLFDAKWYGDERTSREEYERGRAIATALTSAPDRPPLASLGGTEVSL